MITPLPTPLAALDRYPQFILWTVVPTPTGDKKYPVDYRTGAVCSAHDPDAHTNHATAVAASQHFGPAYPVGYSLTTADPFFFVDVDSCLNPNGRTWSQLALDIIATFPGAAVEISYSGRGLHIIGSGQCPPHRCKNAALGLELYTEARFIALTGTSVTGDAATDHTVALTAFTARYFIAAETANPREWTDGPNAEYTGPADDAELLAKALASKSVASAFGSTASFEDLFTANVDRLGEAYPDNTGKQRDFDGSTADAALAQHLAFWTGNDCERIQRLMHLSALRRGKWEREDYLRLTITRAVSLQTTVYGTGTQSAAPSIGPKLRAASDKQRAFADGIRTDILATATPEQTAVLIKSRGAAAGAKFWIDNRGKTAETLAAMVTPISATPAQTIAIAHTVSGYQYLTADLQVEYFRRCVYIRDTHRIFTPDGALLKPDQFNATYGGYSFQMDDTGDKTTRKAWEAFTESQVVRYPKAQAACFRPLMPPGALIEEEGQILVNVYVPIETPRAAGDPAPVLSLVERMLPDPGDRAIVWAYMAACVQHKGVKFQWAPLLQGAEGNGKTLLTRCVAFAVGSRYTHLPPANEISEKFNEWLFNKLFIGIEDVHVPDHKSEIIEILKPMITNDRLAMRAMQQSQVMGDNCANFMLNSNHKDAIRKTSNDRRFAVFYTAQQDATDIIRDGMGGSYFPQMYKWLREGGYAIVSEYLHTYAIPVELNPAIDSSRAPETSSTPEALTMSLGGIEHEILEAIDEGRSGFCGGWVSSVAIEDLLRDQHRARAIPQNRRRDLMKGLGYIWHPALQNGRVNNPSIIDGNKKPRLFIKEGSLGAQLTTAVEVLRVYQEAQGAPAAVGVTAAAFARNA